MVIKLINKLGKNKYKIWNQIENNKHKYHIV
jgi:hypothetical protein